MSTTAHTTTKDLLLRLLEIINRSEWDQLSEIFHEDTITEWPQSNERIRGYANMRKINENYPGGSDAPVDEVQFFSGDEGRYVLTPMFTAVKAEGEGATATSTVKTRYPDGTDWYVVTIAKARDGKLSHVIQYFAPVFEAPEWRAQWVEPIEGTRHAHPDVEKGRRE